MKALIVADGSRGDVQPLIALGRGLVEASHSVDIVTSNRYFAPARAHRLRPIDSGLESVVGARAGANSNISKRPGRIIRYLMKLALGQIQPDRRELARQREIASTGYDVIVAGHMRWTFAHVAQSLNTPFLLVRLVPFGANRQYPFPAGPMFVHEWKLGPGWNRLTHAVMESFFRCNAHAWLNEWRTGELGLDRIRPLQYWEDAVQLTVLYAFSEALIPKPADWPDRYHVTGFWHLPPPESWKPPDSLLTFLDHSDPPVFVGFGSHPIHDNDLWSDVILPTARSSDRRVIIGSGWSCRKSIPVASDVLTVDSIPYDWLFQRVSVVVHHSGVGTCAEAVRSGRPSVMIPLHGEQRFLAARMAELPTGPRPIPEEHLTEARLADSLCRALTDPRIARTVERVSALIRAEQGVAKAVQIIERHAVDHKWPESDC